MSARPVKRTPARKALFLVLAAQRPLLTWSEIADRLNALPGDPIAKLDLSTWRYQMALPKRYEAAPPHSRKRTDARRSVLRAQWGRGFSFDVVLAELNRLPGARLDRMDLHLWRSSLGLPPIDSHGAPALTRMERRARMRAEPADTEPLPPQSPVSGWADATPPEILDWAARVRVDRPAGVPDARYLALINEQRAAYGLPRFRPLIRREERAHAA